jgi:hypothetical protein
VVQGSIAVDGGGGAQIGSSKKNLIYDYNTLSAVVGNAGVNVIQNTWRLL